MLMWFNFRRVRAQLLSQHFPLATFSRLGPDVGVTRSAGVNGLMSVLTDKSLTRQIFFRYTAFVARPITQQSELRYRVQHLHSKKPA